MTYSVKEIFHTLQGEGANTGRAAVFCRFAGCNLWSGLERDRESAVCRFCDTDFVGTDGTYGGKYDTPEALATSVAALWPTDDRRHRFAVLTGGEPMLQVDEPLISALHDRGFTIAIETNGTLEVAPGIDWICVSPKAGAQWVQRSGNELKVVWPQNGLDLDRMEGLRFDHFFLQPKDGAERDRHVRECIERCLQRPRWKLSLQTHKVTGIR